MAVDAFRTDSFFCQEEGGFNESRFSRQIRSSFQICMKHGIAVKWVLEDGTAAGYILAFDYWHMKLFHEKEFSSFFTTDNDSGNARLKHDMEELEGAMGGDEYIYLLSIAVAEKYRNKGIGSRMLGALCTAYSHMGFVSDVSNGESLSIHRRLGFRILESDSDNPCSIVEKAQPALDEKLFEDLRMAVPSGCSLFADRKPLARGKLDCLAARENHFAPAPGSSTEAEVYAVNRQELLSYQRRCRVFSLAERSCTIEGLEALAYVASDKACDTEHSFTDQLYAENAEEWAFIPDITTYFPIICHRKVFKPGQIGEETSINCRRLLNALSFRTTFERGEGSRAIESRIERFALGQVKIQLQSEKAYENGTASQKDLGEAFDACLIVSLDRLSDIGVVSLYIFSCPALVSQYLDTVSREELTFVLEDGQKVGIYDYLKRFGIYRNGSAKSFMTGFIEREDIDDGLLSSLLFCETWYQDGKGLGKVNDRQIAEMLQLERGLSQYNYASVYYDDNILIQLSSRLFSSFKERMMMEAVTMFYIELVMFEEAAITQADSAITSFLSRIDTESSMDTLDCFNTTISQYAKTIDFWDVQVCYPSSKRSVDNIRQHFRIEEMLSRYKRKLEILHQIYETRQDFMNKIESNIITFLGLVLTILSLLEFVFVSRLSTGMQILCGATIATFIILRILAQRRLGRRRKARRYWKSQS